MSPPSFGSRYGAVPFWKTGSETSACSSWKVALAAPQARSPCACGHGEGPVEQLTQLVGLGTGFTAPTAVASRLAELVVCAVVKTAALMTLLRSNDAAVAQSRSGL